MITTTSHVILKQILTAQSQKPIWLANQSNIAVHKAGLGRVVGSGKNEGINVNPDFLLGIAVGAVPSIGLVIGFVQQLPPSVINAEGHT